MILHIVSKLMKSLTEYVSESKVKEYSCISTMQDFLDALIKKDSKKLTVDNLVSSIAFDTFEFNDGNPKFNKPKQMVEYLKKNLNEKFEFKYEDNFGSFISLFIYFKKVDDKDWFTFKIEKMRLTSIAKKFIKNSK